MKQSTNYPGVSPAMKFNQFFRQWVTLCSVANPTQGTYFLQVQTGKKIDGTAAPNAGGSNRFSIQAGIGSNFTASNDVRVYGNGKMGAYANATGADTRFFLTRILPGEAGKTLMLNFFDVGDAALATGQSGTISILPPPDSNVASGTFAGCKYTVPPGNATGPPWGTLTDAATRLFGDQHHRTTRRPTSTASGSRSKCRSRAPTTATTPSPPDAGPACASPSRTV